MTKKANSNPIEPIKANCGKVGATHKTNPIYLALPMSFPRRRESSFYSRLWSLVSGLLQKRTQLKNRKKPKIASKTQKWRPKSEAKKRNEPNLDKILIGYSLSPLCSLWQK